MKPLSFLSALGVLGALSFLPAAEDKKPYPAFGKIERLDPAFDKLIAPDAILENLADGFDWAEGPVWVNKDGGYLLCSDIPKNQVVKWQEGKGKSVFLEPSGYYGKETYYKEPGSNGLLLDPQGRLILMQHGERAVARLEKDGKTITPLAERYDGKRFNSPND